MKSFFYLTVLLFTVAKAADKPIILDENGVSLLGIETIVAEETTFEETAFALGRIEEIPDHRGVLSSRIPGRVVGLNVREGDTVEEGQTLVRVESRQPGDPPPVIELKAPLGGLVVESHIRLGEPVEPDKEMLDISDLSEVWAVARVPEHQAGKLRDGARARIRIAALGGDPLEGKLLRFGTSADREGGTIDAIFHVSNPGLRLRPGMRAEFDIVVSEREDVLSVPKESIQGDPANRHVYVKDFDMANTFLRMPVRTGMTSGGRVEIIGGIFPGDEVVTRGSYSLGFTGNSSGVSLKEAMDAAHGHEHNEDGSEMTEAQKAAREKSTGGEAHDHSVEKSAGISLREKFFMAATGILAALLVVTSLMKRTGNPQTTDPA